MSLAAAAAALGLPEALVKRSAEARAAETGASVDEILAAWAGGEAIAAPAAAAPPPETPQPAAASAAEDEPSPQPTPAPTPTIATPGPAVAPTRAPVPAQVGVAEAAHLPDVITVPTAGIRERTNFVIPTWLTVIMLIVPLFALFALGGASTGACGEATELTADVISGNIENCDGSEFTGGGAGGGGTNYVALGQDIYMGNAVAGVNCSGCHGPNGQGSSAFPALTGVLTTFGACADHQQWVTLGSDGWKAANGNTYGDTNKPVGGGMPTFGNSLTAEQIAAVVTFERVRFGGADPDQALVDCGLAEPADGGTGAGGGDGGTPAQGEGTTTTEPSASLGRLG